MTVLCFRTNSAHLVDMFINHPDVRPTIEAGEHELSSLDLLTDHRNVVYACEGGGALFLYRGPGRYEGHVFLLEGHRGKTGLAFGRAALKALFADHEASTVSARVPLLLSAARAYVRRLGFSSVGEDGLGHELFVMEK